MLWHLNMLWNKPFHCSSGCMVRLLFYWKVKLSPSIKSFAAINRLSIFDCCSTNFDQFLCSYWRKASPHHNTVTTMFHCGDGLFSLTCTFVLHVDKILLLSHLCWVAFMACGKSMSYFEQQLHGSSTASWDAYRFTTCSCLKLLHNFISDQSGGLVELHDAV